MEPIESHKSNNGIFVGSILPTITKQKLLNLSGIFRVKLFWQLEMLFAESV